MNTKLTTFFARYTTWRSIHVMMGIITIVLALIALIAFALPARSTVKITSASQEPASADSNHFQDLLHSQGLSNPASRVPIRSGLFKSAARMRRAAADKTVEIIKSQLTLCSLTSLKGAPIAFVSIEGKGMRPCRIGETVTDRFKVLDIDLEQNRVDIEITGKKTTLNLK